MSLFLQDDWRKNAALTFNLGLRYELLWPFYGRQRPHGEPRCRAGFHCCRAGALRRDRSVHRPLPVGAGARRHQQRRAARRVRVARRPGTVVRGGYGISYNAGAYANIARQMVAQPPFAVDRHADRHRGRATAALDGVHDAVVIDDDEQLRRRQGLRARRRADLERRPVARLPAGLEHRRQLYAHPRLEPRHRPRPQPRSERIADRRRAAVPLADLRGRVGAARRRFSRAAASGSRRRLRR